MLFVNFYGCKYLTQCNNNSSAFALTFALPSTYWLCLQKKWSWKMIVFESKTTKSKISYVWSRTYKKILYVHLLTLPNSSIRNVRSLNSSFKLQSSLQDKQNELQISNWGFRHVLSANLLHCFSFLRCWCLIWF